MTAEATIPQAPTSPALQQARIATGEAAGSKAPLLQLAALDADDLAVMSAHLQDMLVAVGDLAYIPAEHRFALVGKRFDWVAAAGGGCERCAIGLHFDRVRAVSRNGFSQADGERQLNLLAIEFAADSAGAAGGTVTLTFSGHAALRLAVECVEARMRDLGERWPCHSAPAHP